MRVGKLRHAKNHSTFLWRWLNRFMGSEPAAIAGAIQEALWLPSALAQQMAACPFRESKNGRLVCPLTSASIKSPNPSPSPSACLIHE
jgi:hypothetical protein